jgi:hypothetical protein
MERYPAMWRAIEKRQGKNNFQNRGAPTTSGKGSSPGREKLTPHKITENFYCI